ncbi:MAG: sigma-70 family RNA polymerase sigma factor [Pyrinomonadaceae bacterium]
MPNSTPHQISLLLDRWNHGDKLALEQLMPLVYDELRRMARGALRRRPGQSMQTSDLLHETYVKLAGRDEHDWKNRAHFFGVAATAMRHILVDYARGKVAQKRGGMQERLSLKDNIADTDIVSSQVIALEDALKRLADLDERKCRIVELKFFGGLTNEEAAEALDISVETVKRDWRFARAWLLRELDA